MTECAPPPGCGCECHHPMYGYAVSHVVACCDEPPAPRPPGVPDPARIVGQWRDPAEGTAAANRDERESWVPRVVLGETPLDLEGMPYEFHPDAIWTLPNDASLEDAYALLSAAVRRIFRECLDLRTRWANNTDPAHAGAAIPRAVAYQYVAGQLHRAIEGATDIHPPKEHP